MARKNANNARNGSSNRRNSGKNAGKGKGQGYAVKEQPKKDSDSKRVNCDNERESKFIKQFEKDGMRAKTTDGANDISWYSRNPELLKSAASFPFGEVLGGSVWRNSPAYIPGVMVIYFSYAFGGPLSARYNNGLTIQGPWYPEAVNQAGKSSYSFLVHANSRNYNYEYQDLSMVTIAGMQVFAALSHVVRAYGIAKTYAEKSMYKPEAYLRAMGFDPNEIRNNLGTMWFDINNLIAQTSQIWIPSEAPVLKRWIWLSSSLFTDAESALGQTYLFVPKRFFQYNETSDPNGGSLEPATWEDTSAWRQLDVTVVNPWSRWVGTIQHMIDRLVNSEDRGIMFGDILNAYGSDRIFAMPPVPVDTRIEPVFQPAVLTQIENLTVTGADCLGLRQDTQGLYPLMQGSAASAASAASRIAPQRPVLNFHQPQQPTPEQVALATRLTSAGSKVVTDNYTYIVSSTPTEDGASVKKQNSTTTYSVLPMAYGSEVVFSVNFVVKAPSLSAGWNVVSFPYAATYNADTWTMMDGDANVPMDYLSFDWAPFIYRMSSGDSALLATEGADIGNVTQAAGDYDNYTTLNSLELSKLHQMALMSEWGLPII